MSEELLVWGSAGLVVAGIVVPYALSFRRKRHHDRARKEEAVRLGIDRPTAQYPYVDARRCIGCGTCVDACPEGDVLGIVGGTATVVNGLRCVGHGKCEEACPVGAIEVGLGDLKSRQDIPVTDDWLETSVPGLFVAGELGGLALVKNAVAQGRRAVDRIHQGIKARRGPRAEAQLDLVIVGAGPAGVSAALTSAEHRLSYVVLEQETDLGGTIFHYPRRKLVLVQPVEIPLWGVMKEAEYTKEELLAILQQLHTRFQLNVRFGERVLEIRREEAGFVVQSSGAVYRSGHLVLALGRCGTPRKLGVPGEELPKVMYQLIEAESYTNQRILVVGGGDSAVEAAIGLARQPGNRVTLSYRREKLVRIKRKNEQRLQELIERRAVRPLFSSEVSEILAQKVRLRAGGETVDLPNDYVFVFAGGEPPFAFLRQAGVRFGGEAAGDAPLPRAASPPRQTFRT